jgi:hypothetical protein
MKSLANNVYPNCPALMSDGRIFTYWNSSNELTNRAYNINGIKSSNEGRNFLQNNAVQIMQNERNYQKQWNSCSPNVACSEGYWYINNYQYNDKRIPNEKDNRWKPY